MLKYIFLLFFATLFLSSFAQDAYIEEIKAWQKNHDAEFADPEESPLEKRDLKKFHGLDYFHIDNAFRVVASFMRTPNSAPFTMATSTNRLPLYAQYGLATFFIDDKELKLPIYQSQDPFVDEEYKDHLFLPFIDLTCGRESYGGGRYVDLTIPAADSIVIDFNKAYNPYCAYSGRYSCPIPPKENFLDIEIKAGVMAWKEH